MIGLNHEYLYKRVDRSGLKGNLKCRILVNISNTENWLVSQKYKLLATHMSALFFFCNMNQNDYFELEASICIWHHSISKQLVFRVSNWFYISRAFFIPNCILYLKNILYNSVFRAAQVFLVYIKTNWFIIICVAQGFRVVQYFLDFSETQCCSKPCSLNPCSSRTHCT